jgi:DNA polymerase I-like protein with 3'-5' exonuclease and polymerase domains
MVHIAREGILERSGARLHSQVHDALIFQWPKDNLDQVKEAAHVMENVWEPMNGISMAVDVKYSLKSLAEKDMEKWQSTKNY